MRRNVLAALASLVVLCFCDGVWLGVLARDFYAARLGALLLPEPNWVAAALFYPLYVGGLLVFCVRPALAAGSWRLGIGRGAFFGLVAYATYDLSNLATLRGWPVAVTIADIAWGAWVSSVATLAGYAAAARIAPGKDRP
jgi:uncharacterized membrane protein